MCREGGGGEGREQGGKRTTWAFPVFYNLLILISGAYCGPEYFVLESQESE